MPPNEVLGVSKLPQHWSLYFVDSGFINKIKCLAIGAVQTSTYACILC